MVERRGRKQLERGRERERVRKGIGEKGGGEVEIPRRGAVLCQTHMGKCRTKVLQIRISLFLCLPFPCILLQNFHHPLLFARPLPLSRLGRDEHGTIKLLKALARITPLNEADAKTFNSRSPNLALGVGAQCCSVIAR